MLVLIAFNTFVIDYGVMWVGGARRRTPPMPGALAGADCAGVRH